MPLPPRAEKIHRDALGIAHRCWEKFRRYNPGILLYYPEPGMPGSMYPFSEWWNFKKNTWVVNPNVPSNEWRMEGYPEDFIFYHESEDSLTGDECVSLAEKWLQDPKKVPISLCTWGIDSINGFFVLPDGESGKFVLLMQGCFMRRNDFEDYKKG